MTLFEKIIAGRIRCDKVHEDELCFAFHDINPQAPVHILVVPKRPIARLAETTEEDQRLLGHLLRQAAMLAEEQGLGETGFRVVINNGRDGGESVPHLHLHILGGRSMQWPPG